MMGERTVMQEALFYSDVLPFFLQLKVESDPLKVSSFGT